MRTTILAIISALLLCFVDRVDSRVLYATVEDERVSTSDAHHRARRELLDSDVKPVFVLRTRNHGILTKFDERKDTLCVLVACVVYALPSSFRNGSSTTTTTVRDESEEEYARLRIAPGKEIYRKLGNHGEDYHKNLHEADVVLHDMTRRALGRSLVRTGDGTVPTTNVNLLFAMEENEIPARRKYACEADHPIRCVIVPKIEKNRVLYEQFGVTSKRNVLIRVRDGKVQRVSM